MLEETSGANYSSDIDKAISQKLRVTYQQVKEITKAYRGYLRYCVNNLNRESTYLGLVVLRFEGRDHSLTKETYAYQVAVISKELGLSVTLVDAVLYELKRTIIRGLGTGTSHNVRGLFTISSNEDENVRVSKSSTLKNGVRVGKTARFRQAIN